MIAERCQLCGGNAGALVDGVHNLCAARQKLRLPTPSLGERCTKCGGQKVLPHSSCGPMLFLEGNTPGATKLAIEAWAPSCDHCHGTGVEP